MAQHEGPRPVTPDVKLSRAPFLTVILAGALASAAIAASSVGTEAADVLTGTPPSKLKVVPPLVALTGTLPTLLPIELVRNEMTVPLLATAAGTK